MRKITQDTQAPTLRDRRDKGHCGEKGKRSRMIPALWKEVKLEMQCGEKQAHMMSVLSPEDTMTSGGVLLPRPYSSEWPVLPP